MGTLVSNGTRRQLRDRTKHIPDDRPAANDRQKDYSTRQNIPEHRHSNHLCRLRCRGNVAVSNQRFQLSQHSRRKVFFTTPGTFFDRHVSNDDQFAFVPFLDRRRSGLQRRVVTHSTSHNESPSTNSIVFPQMHVREIHGVDLNHIINNLAGDVDDVTVEPFASNKVANETPIVEVCLNHLSVYDSIFNIHNTDSADSTRVPSMAGETILVILNQSADTFQTQCGLVYEFRLLRCSL